LVTVSPCTRDPHRSPGQALLTSRASGSHRSYSTNTRDPGPRPARQPCLPASLALQNIRPRRCRILPLAWAPVRGRLSAIDEPNSIPRPEDAMRAFEHPTSDNTLPTRFAAAGSPRERPATRCLPPTRAARPARSRGVFFGGRRRSRLGHWILNAACIALATLAIAASAHFAQPAFDAAASTGNAGPELLASATRTPSFLLTPRH